MQRYSGWRVLAEGLRGQTGWRPAWRSPEPKSHYDIVLIGGGGHGLATAYYLAKHHGITNVAVIERGWLGGGHTGRNTTVINCGWGTGGFKGIPVGGWTLAHHMATGKLHPLAEAFGLERFRSGALIDEAAASGNCTLGSTCCV